MAASAKCRSSTMTGDVTTYVYDPTSQLIAERHTEGGPRDDHHLLIRSRRQSHPAERGRGATTSTYDAANRLRRSEEVSGITTFTFDNNGNQRRMESPTGDITTYSWTYENQLQVLEDPAGRPHHLHLGSHVTARERISASARRPMPASPTTSGTTSGCCRRVTMWGRWRPSTRCSRRPTAR